MNERAFTIGELAGRAGLSATAVRSYEAAAPAVPG
jgi:DNA-binding transcriptional MerR regulator